MAAGSIPELLSACRVLRTIRSVKDWRKQAEEPTSVDYLFDALTPDRALEEEGVHHRHGFHKDGGPGTGGVVDQPPEFPLPLRLHRHHEPAVPDGDDGLLEHLGVLGAADDASIPW